MTVPARAWGAAVHAEVTVSDGGEITAVAHIPAGHPAFPGHFPGLPVFPAVGLIDLVHDCARRARPDLVRVGRIERCRLRGVVAPGDDVSVKLTMTRTGDGVRCAAKLRTSRGPAADIRLMCHEPPGAGS